MVQIIVTLITYSGAEAIRKMRTAKRIATPIMAASSIRPFRRAASSVSGRTEFTSHPQRGGSLGLAFQVARELGEAIEILRRAIDAAVVKCCGGAEGPERVDEVRPRERDEVGAAGG